MTTIRTVRAVRVSWPVTPIQGRRKSWASTTARALPIHHHAEFRSDLGSATPALANEQVWVQAIASDGTWGLGRCGYGRPVAEIINGSFAPLLERRDPFATELHNDLMWRASLRPGADGHAAVARSGVDLALWDLKGRLLGQPVYRLLGGPVRESIPCYVTCDDLDWALELGFESFKLSNEVHHLDGVAGLDRAEEKVAQAREVVGSGAELMYNPIMSFNVEYTVRLAERLQPYGLRWLEEPLQPWDIRGMAELKRRIPHTPLATGEDHHGRHAFARLIDDRAVDVLQPDIEWCGGLTEATRIHVLAEAAGIATVPHIGANTAWGQHFAMAMIESPMAEFWLGSDPGVTLDQTGGIPGVATPVDGTITPSDAPGFGMEIDDGWIQPW